MSFTPDMLYELLPAYHRRRDAELGYPLQALFEIFAREGAELLDADLDNYADSLFVETCPEALLPHIGALVGAETLRPLPPDAGVSMRAFIGNVLRYRRAKGTALALETLARDVTGYAAKAVEYFLHLSVTQTIRAPRTERPATATLRDPDGRARHGGAFDANPRTLDVRSIARARGRYNIPNVGLHLWRLEAIPYAAPDLFTATPDELAGVPRALEWDAHSGHYALLPEARAVALFQPGHNDDRITPQEPQVPARLRRLPLWRELEDWRAAIVRGEDATFERRWFADAHEPFTIFIRRIGEAKFTRVPAQQVMIGALVPNATVPTPPWTRPPATKSYPNSLGVSVDLDVALVIDPATGRLVIAAPAAGLQDVEAVRVAHALGQPGALGGGAYDRNDFEAPFEVASNSLVYLVGSGAAAPGTTRFADLGAALNAWALNGADRRGFIVVTESFVDAPSAVQPTLAFAMPANSDLTVVAAEWRAPSASSKEAMGFIVRRSRRLMLLRLLQIKTSGALPAQAGRLTLDGIYANQGLGVDAGALMTLAMRHSTLRADNGTALDLQGAQGAPLAVSLYRCISDRIAADVNVGGLRLQDTIIARHAALAAIDALASELDLEHVTVFGGLVAKVLNANNSILMGVTQVERRQQGCVRYSFLGEATGQLPRRYRCQPELAQTERATALKRALSAAELQAIALSVRPMFVDTEPDAPAYAQLAMDAPRAIAFGGEGETEMGAWGFLGGPTRLANLTDLLVDYTPFGLEAAALRADRSAVEAQGSNVP